MKPSMSPRFHAATCLSNTARTALMILASCAGLAWVWAETRRVVEAAEKAANRTSMINSDWLDLMRRFFLPELRMEPNLQGLNGNQSTLALQGAACIPCCALERQNISRWCPK